MRVISFLVSLCSVAELASCNRHDQHDVRGAPVAIESGRSAGAFQPIAEIAAGEWRMPSGDYGNLRYSSLDSIRPSNVQNLRVITTFSTGIPNGHEGQPLVVETVALAGPPTAAMFCVVGDSV